jgi:hypothetical protein
MIMKKKILFLFIVLLNLGCSHPKTDNANRKPKQNASPVVAIKQDSLKPATTTALNDSDSPEYPDWADTIIASYVMQTNNGLVRKAIKEKLKEEWVYDQLQKTDTATYWVFNIGHDVANHRETNVRFISDSWVYLDSLKRKLYEYDSVNGKIVEWKK